MTVLEVLAVMVAVPAVWFFFAWLHKGGPHHHFADLEVQYGWDKDDPRTKLDGLIATYMAQDPIDPSSTINFLLAVDELEDPFADAPAPVIQPPPKPSDAATSAKPPWARKGPAYSVMDERCQGALYQEAGGPLDPPDGRALPHGDS